MAEYKLFTDDKTKNDLMNIGTNCPPLDDSCSMFDYLCHNLALIQRVIRNEGQTSENMIALMNAIEKVKLEASAAYKINSTSSIKTSDLLTYEENQKSDQIAAEYSKGKKLS